MSRANEGELGALHGVVARYLVEKIQSGEASASDVSNAIKLLKDNNITCLVEDSKDLEELQRQLNGGVTPDATDFANALDQLDFSQKQAH